MIKLLDRPIAYQRAFVSIGCGITGAVMLSQAVYWAKRSAGKGGWFYKTQSEWEEETGLTRYEQEGARKKLKNLGVLDEVRKGIPCKVHYRVNETTLTMLLSQYVENQQTSSCKNSSTSCGKVANSDAEHQQTNTETTQRLPETTTETTEKNKSAASPSVGLSKSDIDQNKVFEHWQVVHGKQQAKLIKNRLSKINARFKEGYTVEQLNLAIDGCKLSSFHMGQNDKGTPYNDLTTILRDGAQVEKFIELALNGPVTKQSQPDIMEQSANSDWHKGDLGL